jgi:hypothetical protein
MKKILALCALLFGIQTINSQVLISLIFGEMLNSPKVEFGWKVALIFRQFLILVFILTLCLKILNEP